VVDFANYVACLHSFRNSWELQKWPGLRYIYSSFFSVFDEKMIVKVDYSTTTGQGYLQVL